MKTYEEKQLDYRRWYEYGFSSYEFKSFDEIEASVIAMFENDTAFIENDYDDVDLFIREMVEFIAREKSLKKI